MCSIIKPVDRHMVPSPHLYIIPLSTAMRDVRERDAPANSFTPLPNVRSQISITYERIADRSDAVSRFLWAATVWVYVSVPLGMESLTDHVLYSYSGCDCVLRAYGTYEATELIKDVQRDKVVSFISGNGNCVVGYLRCLVFWDARHACWEMQGRWWAFVFRGARWWEQLTNTVQTGPLSVNLIRWRTVPAERIWEHSDFVSDVFFKNQQVIRKLSWVLLICRRYLQ